MGDEDPTALLLIQTRALGLPEPAREHAFGASLGRKWRADLAWLWPRYRQSRAILVEIDGGSWVGGRHTSGSGFVADLEKLNAAALLGFLVLRFTPADVKSGIAAILIELAFNGTEPTAEHFETKAKRARRISLDALNGRGWTKNDRAMMHLPTHVRAAVRRAENEA